jgi:ubiquinone/menaquinone biosynthesis C-methylase UbiE
MNGKITEQFHENRRGICSNRVTYSSQFLEPKDNVLDIGAGAGTFAKLLNEQLDLETIECAELDDRLVTECKQLGFETVQSGILELPEDKEFDVVFMWHVLEHIQDVKKSIEKLGKIMKKRALIEVPLLVALDGNGRRRDLTPPNEGKYDGHYHYFCERSFRKLAKNAGMRIVDLREGVQSPALLAVIEHA